MKRLVVALLALTLLPSARSEGRELLKMTSWHLTPASDVVSHYSATCGGRSYRLTATTAAGESRASALDLAVEEGSERRTFDLTKTALGQLLSDRTGFGELRFACRPTRLFVFYRGATAADAAATVVPQQAVFAISSEGKLSVPPPEGVTVTPLPD